MDFALNDQQKDIKQSARKFAEKEFPAVAKICDETEKMDMDLLEKARDNGFIGGIIPEAYGGPALSFFENSLIVEEFWRIDPGIGQAIISVTFGAEILIAYASEEHKKKYLAPLVEGRKILATAITEPNAGSDVTSATTSAVKDGNEYVISGNKMFITNGSLCDYMMVLCKTHPNEPSPHNQYSMIMVDKDAKGLEVNKIKNKLGIRASNTTEVALDEVRVPVANLIGKEKEGFKHIFNLFNRERITVCAQATGLAQGALEQAINYTLQRKQFRAPLASFQAIRFKIAEMATLVEACRSLYYRAAWTIDSGIEDHALVGMAKWFCGEKCVSVVQDALQLHGGYGFMNEFDIARFYRDAKIVEIYEGTKEMEKMQIANALLGKPGK